MASKFFPLRVLLSCKTGTASRLINFSDGGGDPSTQPFQPFFTATRFFGGGRGAGGGGAVSNSSKSSGVRGLLDEVRDVLDEMEGPGVDAGVDGKSKGDEDGGGVTEIDRCIVAMWIAGRAFQKDDVVVVDWGAGTKLVLATGVALDASRDSRALAAAFAFFLSRSRAFFSLFLCLLVCSSSNLSAGVYGSTPFKRLVSTSRGGRISKAPATTEVAVRRARFAGFMMLGRGGRMIAMMEVFK